MMTFRIKALSICGAIILLALALSWSVYRTSNEINRTFITFAYHDMQTLHHLFSIRNSLGEQERLLYEYYVNSPNSPLLSQLVQVGQQIESDLEFLSVILSDDSQWAVLKKSYAEFTGELQQLYQILQGQVIDRDAARISLSGLMESGQQTGSVLDELFQKISTRTNLAQEHVESQLEEMTVLVIGYVITVLILTLAMVYFTQETLQSEVARKRLAFFPERNPNPVFSLTLDGEVTYTSPSGHRFAANIKDNLDSVLPPDIKERVRNLANSEEQSLYFEYELQNHVLSARLQFLPDLELCHLYVSDITVEREAGKKLRFLAFYDPVSGLPNRQKFLDDCTRWCSDSDFDFTVFNISFLRFELVVRNLGLDLVDELLKCLADRLNDACIAAVKEQLEISLYRLSGAGFAAMLRAHNGSELRCNAERVGNILLSVMEQPLRVQRREFWLRPVIGTSFCPDDAVTSELLIAYASKAMAHLASKNQHGYQQITKDILRSEDAWLESETAIRRGLDESEFRIYYQPLISASDYRTGGWEALLRWYRPGHGTVSPGNFIAVAEDSGLIHQLGEWVLNESCRQAIAWAASGHDQFIISVNVSPLQFQRADFPERIRQALVRHGLDSRYLELEITESRIMQDLARNLSTLNVLKDMGLGVALDDFGTGYSSMEYLQRLPVTKIKIDRGFIRGISENIRDRAVVSTMIELAHNLGIKVVAEGVETEQQVSVLKRLGCDVFQGDYFHNPMAPDDVGDWRFAAR